MFPEHKVWVHSLLRKACAWNLILAFEVFFYSHANWPYQINWKNQMCFTSPTVAALQHSSPKLTPSFVWHKTHTAEKNGHTSTSFFETDIPNLWLLIMKCATWSAVVDLCNDWLLSVSYARARTRKSLREVSDSNAQGPVRTTTKIEFGVCKKGEKFVITNFFVFVILFASKTRSVNYGLFNWPRCQNSSRS